MRARVIELEGTEAEVLRGLAELRGAGAEEVLEETAETGPSPDVPDTVKEWFKFWRVGNPQRRYISEVVKEVSSWGDVEVKIFAGRGEDRFSGRLRFVRSDQQEAFGILGHKGRMFLRLPADFDISDYSHAKQRDTTTKRHGILMYVRSQDAVSEAIDLLGKAYALQQG